MTQPLSISDFLLDQNITFLNHGSFGACCKPAFDSLLYWHRELERDPDTFFRYRLPDELHRVRTIVAEYLGTTSNNLVFFPNPTTAMKYFVRNLGLKAGDEILGTTFEYPSMEQIWKYVCAQTGAKFIQVPVPLPLSDKQAFIDALWQGVTENTKVIFTSHICYFSSLIFPVEEISVRARNEGILTIVDGAHAPSQIPVNLDKLGVDIYVGASYKWLCAPKSTGFAYVRPDVQDKISQLLQYDNWLQRDEDGNHPKSFGKYLESLYVVEYQSQGVQDYSAILSVPDAIKFQKDNDWDNQRCRCHELASEALQRMTALTGLQALHPDSPMFYSQMISIPIPWKEGTDIGQYMRDRNIIIAPMNAFDRPIIRLSFQAYNTEEDIDTFMNAYKIFLSDSQTAS